MVGYHYFPRCIFIAFAVSVWCPKVFGTLPITTGPPIVDIKDYGYIAVVIEKVPREDLWTDEYFRCTGLLISRQIVFTTCSCIGTFNVFRGIYQAFEPISYEVFQVVLGVGDLSEYVKALQKVYPTKRIDSVVPHPKCSWDRIAGFKFNLGAIKMEEAVLIRKPLAFAPALLEQDSSAIEKETLKRIILEKKCYVLGYGEFDVIKPRVSFPLRFLEVKFITFAACNRRVSLKSTGRSLRHIDIADSGDMCMSAANESDNCFADLGSPLLCDGKLTGMVTFRQNCRERASPMLAARLEDAVDFYNSLRSSATKDHSHQDLVLISIILKELY